MDFSLTRIGKCANCTDRLPGTSTIKALFEAVRSDRYAQPVRYIRHCVANDDEGASNEAKGRLPAAMPSGVFRYRSNAGIVKYTGIVVADFDDVEDMDYAKDAAGNMPFVFGWFVSPSGTGLKVWCATTETDPLWHPAAVATVSMLFAESALTMDPKCGDLARLCYVSHDPAAWMRECRPVEVDRSAAGPYVKRERVSIEVSNPSSALASACRSIENFQAIQGQGGERVTWDVCNAGHDHGVPLEEWWPIVRMWNEQSAYPPWRESELRRKLESTYRNNRRPFGGLMLLDGIL